MACYAPIRAFRDSSGGIHFAELRADFVDAFDLPCGRCVGCRLERSRQWAVRLVHEASLWESSYFVTLTYAVAPSSLDYRDFRLFMRRLRHARKGVKVRFFCCGEYGEQLNRPHFHALLFNVDFPDKVVFSDSSSGVLWSSAELERLWSHGFCTIGQVSFESARYCASYILKKVTGDPAESHYRLVDPETGEITDRLPEFCQMSRRPGIGHDWLRLYWQNVYPSGSVVVQGREGKAPRYYDRLARHLQPFAEAQAARYRVALRYGGDNTDERLRVRREIAEARSKLKERSLDGRGIGL